MRYLGLAIALLSLVSCSAPARRPVLRDIDVSANEQRQAGAMASPKNREQIRKAYMEYLNHASKNDRSRADALYRLAQLEFEQTENQNGDNRASGPDEARDPQMDAATDRTIELLRTLLRDRPKAAENDKALYQLARAYDRRGLVDKSIETLSRLVNDYPKSPYYVESRFRIAEHSFIRGDYGKSEDFYTDVLVSRNNGLFREKAFYKRGWARYKQGYYREAVDDFIKVTNISDFDDLTHLSDARKSDFDEYFRAIGLSFIYMGGPEAVNEYFKENPDFRYLYQAYDRTANVYLAQNRYSDAVSTLQAFNKQYPKSSHVPEATLKVVEIWNIGGFTNNFVQALDEFYTSYHPESNYWTNRGADPAVRQGVAAALKDFVVLATVYFHKAYQATSKETDFAQARRWYERYLKHYRSYARKDNVHYLYAQLLSQHDNDQEALTHYEVAAYDGDIIVNKDAAYASIITLAKLYKRFATETGYRDKLIRYSSLYVQFYRDDARSIAVAAHAADEAYRAGMYRQAIAIGESLSNAPYTEETFNLKAVTADAYFKVKRYADAEVLYQGILQYPDINTEAKSRTQDNLALSIYHQGDVAKAQNNLSDAIRHYVRISQLVPTSDIAATGLYDAVALAYDNKLWPDTVKYAEQFEKLYPAHKLSHDTGLKLSVAYLNTHDEGAAASTLIKLAHADENVEYKIAALWKAAGLYESKKDYPSAIKTYEEYAHNYQRPYPQYAEAVRKLIDLSITAGDEGRATQWRAQMLDVEKRTPSNLKTDRTNYICSLSALELARAENRRYSSVKLSLPLDRSLKQKKSALQKTLNLYSVVSSYGVRETATEAMHSMGDVCYSFSKALLESERPKGLSEMEQEQYKILLEDQAFPFEDNAIKFYEKNILYTKQGIFDEWVRKSYAQLRALSPARYDREVMLEPYINVLH